MNNKSFKELREKIESLKREDYEEFVIAHPEFIQIYADILSTENKINLVRMEMIVTILL